MSTDLSIKEKMSAEISEKLNDAFDAVIKQKNEYYQNHPQAIPDFSKVDSLVSSCALTNAAISGGASLVPGPWGMAAVIPEIALVARNQIAMIYDIAAANGKKDLMTKELAATVFAYSMGTATGGLLLVHGSKVIVKRASLRVLQNIITMLGGKITQQLLKSTLSKWIPGVGAAAMAAWTNYSTKQIGKKAQEILSSNIVIEGEVSEVELIEPINTNATKIIDVPTTQEKSIGYYSLQVLIALSKIDGETSQQEAEFIGAAIENAEIPDAEKIELIGLLAVPKVKVEGLELIKESPDDAISLLSTLTALAKIDNNLHITEKLFIKQVGKAFGFSESDINDLLAS